MKNTFSPARVAALLFALIAFAFCKPENNPSGGGVSELEKLTPGLSSIPQKPSTEEPCVLYYKAGGSYPFAGYGQDLYVHIWIRNIAGDMYAQSEWAVNTDRLKLRRTDVEDLWSLEIGPSVREWFGVAQGAKMSRIGVVVRNADGSRQTADMFVDLDDASDVFVPSDVEQSPLPSGVRDGINYLSDSEVCLVLRDLDKEGRHYDHAYVVGEFSGWDCDNTYQMKRDEDASCWWYTFSGVEPGKEYMFQYHLSKDNGDYVRIGDAYSEIVYSREDSYIPSSTYPSMPSFPANTSDVVSAFQTARPSYEWKVSDFGVEDSSNLIIYELHLRDFSATGDLDGCLAKLDYLKDLGVNAIESMPVQEFDGNDSWGYNPRAYFALDKAYGTRDKYKEFVDKCHEAGIAVLADVVYNHATGSHPMAKMYWDSVAGKTSAANPWFNVDAPHPYSVFHDWNHEDPTVREHIKRSLEYLLEEYRFDGFRFDLAKGFSQRKVTESNVSSYDASRIAILKDYAACVHAVKPDAVVILEHFCDSREERELAQNGMLLWRNLNNAYCQTAMGWLKDGDDLSGMYTGNTMPYGSLVGYMESHDEERTAYKALKWGAGEVASDLAVRMRRLSLNAAFSLLVPGPKMIWQFGELGYDISIEENGRTGAKPLHWEYADDSARAALHDTYRALIRWRLAHPEFYNESAVCTMNVGSGRAVRTITITSGESALVVAGNFDTAEHALSVALPVSGDYVDILSGASYHASSGVLDLGTVKGGEFVVIYKN